MDDMERQRLEALELGDELIRFKKGKLFAYLHVRRQASYIEALNKLTCAALESTDLKVRGFALDVLKTTRIWDDLDEIQTRFDSISAENAPANEPRSEYQYVTP